MIEGIRAINSRIEEIQSGFAALGFGSPIDSKVKTFSSYMEEAEAEINKTSGIDISSTTSQFNVSTNNINNIDGIKDYIIENLDDSFGLENLATLNKGYDAYRNIIDKFPTKYDTIIDEASQLYDVPKELIKAIIKQESNYDNEAISRRGAVGLMQLMPSTANQLGVPLELLTDAKTNIFAGTKYLSDMLSKYDGRIDLALSAYNAGPNAVKDSIPNIEETKNYVKNILSYLQ